MTTETHVHTNRCWWNPDEAGWVCRPAATPDRPLVDVRDMLVVHTALLRELRLAPEAVLRVAPGEHRQVAAVADHLDFVCGLLHHHHEGEDELLWPLLRQRTDELSATLIDEVEAQHQGIDAALADVQQARAAWVSSGDQASRDLLTPRLRDLHALLAEHLDLEERALLPLAAATLTPGEWNAIGAAAAAATPKPALPLVFGMFGYEGDPAVLRTMLAAAPALPRLLLPVIAPRVYARRARRVYGTATP